MQSFEFQFDRYKLDAGFVGPVVFVDFHRFRPDEQFEPATRLQKRDLDAEHKHAMAGSSSFGSVANVLKIMLSQLKHEAEQDKETCDQMTCWCNTDVTD